MTGRFIGKKAGGAPAGFFVKAAAMTIRAGVDLDGGPSAVVVDVLAPVAVDTANT